MTTPSGQSEPSWKWRLLLACLILAGAFFILRDSDWYQETFRAREHWAERVAYEEQLIKALTTQLKIEAIEYRRQQVNKKLDTAEERAFNDPEFDKFLDEQAQFEREEGLDTYARDEYVKKVKEIRDEIADARRRLEAAKVKLAQSP